MGRRYAVPARPGLPTVSLMGAGPTHLQYSFMSASLRLGQAGERRGSRSLGLARRVLAWRRGDDGGTVVCIACGDSVTRSDAREYDKHGDRFDRRDKQFEYLCKRCHRDIDHKPRRDLEAMLVEFEARDRPREEFLSWYCGRVEEGDGPLDGE